MNLATTLQNIQVCVCVSRLILVAQIPLSCRALAACGFVCLPASWVPASWKRLHTCTFQVRVATYAWIHIAYHLCFTGSCHSGEAKIESAQVHPLLVWFGHSSLLVLSHLVTSSSNNGCLKWLRFFCEFVVHQSPCDIFKQQLLFDGDWGFFYAWLAHQLASSSLQFLFGQQPACNHRMKTRLVAEQFRKQKKSYYFRRMCFVVFLVLFFGLQAGDFLSHSTCIVICSHFLFGPSGRGTFVAFSTHVSS